MQGASPLAFAANNAWSSGEKAGYTESLFSHAGENNL